MVKSEPLVSILMPAYNAEKYVEEAITSIVDQTYENWELLICDDASEDNLSSIITQFADRRIKKLRNDTNEGYQVTCNRLLKLAKGYYITFQDADDFSDEDRLKKQVEVLEEDASIGMCGTLAYSVSTEGAKLNPIDRPISYEEVMEAIQLKSAFLGATVMIRQDIYSEVGGYRDFFNQKGYQDYDWTYLIAEKYKAVNIPEYLYFYRQHGSSNSKKIEIDRLLGKEYVQFLAKQRKGNNGHDALTNNTLMPAFESFLQSVKHPYLQDKSLIYRKYAATYMYHRMYRNALTISKKAIKINPVKVVNYRTYLYCLRKSLLKRNGR